MTESRCEIFGSGKDNEFKLWNSTQRIIRGSRPLPGAITPSTVAPRYLSVEAFPSFVAAAEKASGWAKHLTGFHDVALMFLGNHAASKNYRIHCSFWSFLFVRPRNLRVFLMHG